MKHVLAVAAFLLLTTTSLFAGGTGSGGMPPDSKLAEILEGRTDIDTSSLGENEALILGQHRNPYLGLNGTLGSTIRVQLPGSRDGVVTAAADFGILKDYAEGYQIIEVKSIDGLIKKYQVTHDSDSSSILLDELGQGEDEDSVGSD